MEIPFSCLMFCPGRSASKREIEKEEIDLGRTAGGHFTGERSRKSKVRSFSKMWGLPLPTHLGNRAVEAQKKHFAGNACAARRRHVGWRNRGACRRTVWLSKPRAVGGAKRDAPCAGI